MRDARLAEWILSLVTTRDRAASTVGDLMEEAAVSGRLRFWASVSHTALVLLFRDLASSPVRMAGLGALGLLVQLLLVMLIGALIGSAYAALVLSFGRGALDPQHLPFLPLRLVGYASDLPVGFLVGRMLANKSPGHELTPCVAMILVGVAISAVWAFIDGAAIARSMLDLTIYQIPDLLALLAGAISVRRRRHGLA